MKISKEVKIGAVVVICLKLLFWGANYLKGINLFKSNRVFYALYDHVDGLGISDPVIVNGYKVGQILDVKFLQDFSGRLLVSFSIKEEGLRIPEDTKARIVSSDLLGSKSINLLIGTSDLLAQEKDTLISEVEMSLTEAVNQQIAPLKSKAEGLIGTIDSTVSIFSTIFNKEARDDLGSSFTSIKNSIESFEKTMLSMHGIVESEKERLHGILVNVESITTNLAKNNETLSKTLINVERITDSLAVSNLKGTIANASEVMNDFSLIVEKINNGEGSLGQLLNNDTLYRNLEVAADDLDKLLIDMRLNPERYVHFSIFGRRDKGKKEN